MAARMRLVDPILRQEELFILMCSDEILDLASTVMDAQMSWAELNGFVFESFCNASLEREDMAPSHPDVAGIAVRQVLTEDVPEEFIEDSCGPHDAREAGLYYWC